MNNNFLKNKDDKKDFEYIKLAQLIQDGIIEGEYNEGSKLPSIRSLRRNHNLSISTILKAFYELEKKGLIIAKEKYGYYVNESKENLILEPLKKCKLKAQTINKSNIINSIIKYHNESNIFSLGSSLLSKSLVPEKKIEYAFRKVISQNEIDTTRYCFPPGLEELRKQIVLKYKEYGLISHYQDVVITNGCMDSVTLALNLIAKPGDIIAIESPTYYGFLQLIESLGMYAVEIPANPITGIEVDKFEELISKNDIKACILISNFNNPMGYSVSDENKEKIVQLASKKEVYIIESDVYSDLYFGDHRPKTYKNFDTVDIVFTCSSLSKTVSAGLRLGWIINAKFAEKIQKQQFINTVAVSTITQALALIYLRECHHERHLKNLRKVLKNKLLEIKNMILKHFPEDTKISSPAGGFLLLVELDKKIDSLELYRNCLEENITIMPGIIHALSDRFNNHIRLSYAYNDRDEYEGNLIKLTNIIKMMQP